MKEPEHPDTFPYELFSCDVEEMSPGKVSVRFYEDVEPMIVDRHSFMESHMELDKLMVIKSTQILFQGEEND